MDRADERSAFAWIMSGTVGAVMVGSLGKVLLDRRRERALAEAQAASAPPAADQTDAGQSDPGESDAVEAEGHPS